ncbi:MAG: glycogen/starch/alpha-glucan phosphorylase, partial [Beijerinckiaceae bacterium]
EESVLAVAYDTPVVGWRGQLINTLRLWSAKSLDPISLDAFNRGDHVGAMHERNRAETISRVLYPSDSNPAGQELRLRQEFFFTSASLQDLIRRHMQRFGDIRSLAEKAAIQLNDTHPSIAIAELMRILVDIHGLPWIEAWDLTRRATSYTNHTLLPEALETWPVELMERLLPRHLQIIYAINAHFLNDVRSRGNTDPQTIAALSLIDENHGRRIRMGNLAFVGSHKINGVSALHSELMKETVFHDLDKVLPGRITNKTNGITPRRWLTHANPALTELLCDLCGDGVLDNLEMVSGLNRFVDDSRVQAEYRAIKRANKEKMAQYIAREMHLKVNPDAIFDVHVKRIHEYKRQLLNILETIALYQAMRSNPDANWAPRVKIFAGKAAASYVQAKSIIKLINDVARTVNADPAVRDLLKIAFIPNFNVSLAEVIVPAADLSEQISTAGTEASGTGNMKFALNGAVTIGTLDGANVEIRERVGADNIVIFGLTAAEVERTMREGYRPGEIIEKTPMLRGVLDAVANGEFSPEDRSRFVPLVDSLYNNDRFLIAADFASYEQAQRRVEAIWSDEAVWTKMAMRNTANVGWFSSDRTIREYADEIWQVPCDLKVGE